MVTEKEFLSPGKTAGALHWGTQDEINFVEELGSYRELHTPTFDRRIKSTTRHRGLLKNYIKAASLRENWGKINKDKVMKRAAELYFRGAN